MMHTIKTTQRATRAGAAVLLAMGAFGCMPEDTGSAGDDLAGVSELEQDIAAFTGTCTFVVSGGPMTVAFTGADTAVLSKRAVDSAILVNGRICQSADAVPVTATSSNVKSITVNGSSGNDTLIVDFNTGTFSPGTSSVVGITVDLAAGTNAFKFRGQKTADNVTLGMSAATPTLAVLSVATAFKDISVATATATPSFTLALSDGNDVVNTGGNAVTGTTFTKAITVYGGNGNDTFNEGATQNGNAVYWGGVGSDTVSYALRTVALGVSVDGVANDGDASGTPETDNVQTDIEIVTTGTAGDTLKSSGTASVTLNGGAGNDIFDEGNTASTGTIFNGGAGTDTVTYASRSNTQAVTITMGAGANDGETGSENDNVQADVEAVVGSAGDDTITGGAGNDSIKGGPGLDTLNGGAGDDIFDMGSASDGADVIIGGAGVDTVDYSARTNALTVDMNSTSAATLYSGEGMAAAEHDDIRTDVENCLGGTGNDTITGNDANNELVGGAGDDTLAGGLGDDTLEGGAQATTAGNALDCGVGDDIAISTGANDTVNANCEL